MDVVVFHIILRWSFKYTLLLGNAGQRTVGLGQTQFQVIEVLCEKSLGREAPPIVSCMKALRTIFLHYESNELVDTLSVHKTLVQML